MVDNRDPRDVSMAIDEVTVVGRKIKKNMQKFFN
jgi:hypothetical protein